MPHSPVTPSPFRFTLNTTCPDKERNHHPAQSQKQRKLTAPTSLHHAESHNSPSSSARECVREHKSRQFARTPRFAHPLSTSRLKEYAASPLVASRRDNGSLGDKKSNERPGTRHDVFEQTNAAPVQNHNRRGTTPERAAESDDEAAGEEGDEDEEMLDPGSENDDEEEFLIPASTERDARTEAREITLQTDSANTPAAKGRRIGGLAAMDNSAWASKKTPHNSVQPRFPSPPTSPHSYHLPDRTTPTRKKPPINFPHHQQDTSLFTTPQFHPPPHFTPHPTSTPVTPRTHSNHARHKYILPRTTDQNTTPALLPDAFSPHRRKERFVPHGWASTLRSWIVDASCSPSSDNKADEMTIRVEAVSPSGGAAAGITFLRAAVAGETRRMVNVVLIGEVGVRNGCVVSGTFGGGNAIAGGGHNNGGGGQKTVLSAGTRVQLRAPMWDVWLAAGGSGEHGSEGDGGEVELQDDNDGGRGFAKDDAAGGKIWVICASWRVV